MDIYNIKDTYIEFIRAYDNRVADNKNESRPYIGIILLIGDVKYTPLSLRQSLNIEECITIKIFVKLMEDGLEQSISIT